MMKKTSITLHSVFFFLPVLFIFIFLAPSPTQAQPSPYQLIPVSVNLDGQAGNRNSFAPSISFDGRFVTFLSNATNLIKDAQTHSCQVYLYDSIDQSLRLISAGKNGVPGNAPSLFAKISGNGRLVVFETLANNLSPLDKDTTSDLYIYDQITKRVSLFRPGYENTKPNARLSHLSISYDGRYITFITVADNITINDNNDSLDVFLYDYFTGVSTIIPLPNKPESPIRLLTASITPNGRNVLVLTSTESHNASSIHIYDYHRVTKTFTDLTPNGIRTNQFPTSGTISMTNNGSIILFTVTGENANSAFLYLVKTKQQTVSTPNLANPVTSAIISPSGNAIILVERTQNEYHLVSLSPTNNTATFISPQIIAGTPAASEDGTSIAFTAPRDGINQVFIARKQNAPAFSYRVHGQILNQGAAPLGVVIVKASDGSQIKTDANGFFYLSVNKAKRTAITFAKEGYEFNPPAVDISPNMAGTNIQVTAYPANVIREAQMDIGMPYDFDRGCKSSSPHGCGKPYHGFEAGYCTDLILDAYTWGTFFNINQALLNDYNHHPDHFYYWRNARNAHDMWRFFAYTKQLISNDAPYYPGDIVFFDWNNDGEIDHVSLVTEITASHRPKFLIEATGQTRSNPSGLTSELPWETFHKQTVRGHARWNGLFIPATNAPSQPDEWLQIALSAPEASLHVYTGSGESLTPNWGKHTEVIMHHVLDRETSMSIHNPLKTGTYYRLRISTHTENHCKPPFLLSIQILHNSIITDRYELRKGSECQTSHDYAIYLIKKPDGHPGIVVSEIKQTATTTLFSIDIIR